jgi:hypothetical protein
MQHSSSIKAQHSAQTSKAQHFQGAASATQHSKAQHLRRSI